jgi:uncharacterized protein
MGDVSNEPSMEDILASIKKIIAEDADRKISPPAKRINPSASVAVKAEEAPAMAPIADPIIAKEEVLELADPVEETPEILGEPTVSDLVSAETALASRAALASLSDVPAAAAPALNGQLNGQITVEALVRSMLQPMLKDWLDARLPEIVERIVAREVARISGR